MKANIGKYKTKRKINIKIEPYDTWNMDHTLALIIVPMLKQLKSTKNGVPGEYYNEVTKEIDEEGWDLALDRMIWSFSRIAEDDEEDFFTLTPNNEAYMAYNSCIQDGIDLFAKYYRNLWD